eukprot:4583677-Alexandrium_andersonii.AAC.1
MMRQNTRCARCTTTKARPEEASRPQSSPPQPTPPQARRQARSALSGAQRRLPAYPWPRELKPRSTSEDAETSLLECPGRPPSPSWSAATSQ